MLHLSVLFSVDLLLQLTFPRFQVPYLFLVWSHLVIPLIEPRFCVWIDLIRDFELESFDLSIYYSDSLLIFFFVCVIRHCHVEIILWELTCYIVETLFYFKLNALLICVRWDMILRSSIIWTSTWKMLLYFIHWDSIPLDGSLPNRIAFVC